MWQWQAQQLCAVLEEHGEKYLESWQVPLLTWEELQELKQLYEAAPMPTLESPGSGAHLLPIHTATSGDFQPYAGAIGVAWAALVLYPERLISDQRC